VQYPGGGAPAGQTREPDGKELSVEAGEYVSVVDWCLLLVVGSQVNVRISLSVSVGGLRVTGEMVDTPFVLVGSLMGMLVEM
jgi:hypothetical protein